MTSVAPVASREKGGAETSTTPMGACGCPLAPSAGRANTPRLVSGTVSETGCAAGRSVERETLDTVTVERAAAPPAPSTRRRIAPDAWPGQDAYFRPCDAVVESGAPPPAAHVTERLNVEPSMAADTLTRSPLPEPPHTLEMPGPEKRTPFPAFTAIASALSETPMRSEYGGES